MHRIKALNAGMTLFFVGMLQQSGAQPVPDVTKPGSDEWKLEGTISDRATSAPVAGATVTVKGANYEIYKATSDFSGHYLVEGSNSGLYRVSVRKKGYGWVSSTDEKSIRLSGGASTSRLDLKINAEVVISGRVFGTAGACQAF